VETLFTIAWNTQEAALETGVIPQVAQTDRHWG